MLPSLPRRRIICKDCIIPVLVHKTIWHTSFSIRCSPFLPTSTILISKHFRGKYLQSRCANIKIRNECMSGSSFHSLAKGYCSKPAFREIGSRFNCHLRSLSILQHLTGIAYDTAFTFTLNCTRKNFRPNRYQQSLITHLALVPLPRVASSSARPRVRTQLHRVACKNTAPL